MRGKTSSVENPLSLVVKFKGSNCAPTAIKLLGIDQTYSKERHCSMAKVKTGICDYNTGIFLKIVWKICA